MSGRLTAGSQAAPTSGALLIAIMLICLGNIAKRTHHRLFAGVANNNTNVSANNQIVNAAICLIAVYKPDRHTLWNNDSVAFQNKNACSRPEVIAKPMMPSHRGWHFGERLNPTTATANAHLAPKRLCVEMRRTGPWSVILGRGHIIRIAVLSETTVVAIAITTTVCATVAFRYRAKARHVLPQQSLAQQLAKRVAKRFGLSEQPFALRLRHTNNQHFGTLVGRFHFWFGHGPNV